MNLPVPRATILNAILTGIEGNPGQGGCGVNFAVGDYEFEFVIDKVTDNQALGTVYLEDWDRLGENEEVMRVALSARVLSVTTREDFDPSDAELTRCEGLTLDEQHALSRRIVAGIESGAS